MMTVSIIGTGNLASHLASGLTSAGVQVLEICGRNREETIRLAESIGSWAVFEVDKMDAPADVILVAVSDSAIGGVSAAINSALEDDRHAVVAHTAGSVKSDVLEEHPNFGVFYPLQTFSTDRSTDWSGVPLLITGNNEASTDALTTLASRLSRTYSSISDSERLVLHLCATIANNFSNHMFAIAERIASEHDLSFDLLKPLILETATKVQSLAPELAQTGAAVRNDFGTINRHLEILQDHPELASLYREVTASIQRLSQQ